MPSLPAIIYSKHITFTMPNHSNVCKLFYFKIKVFLKNILHKNRKIRKNDNEIKSNALYWCFEAVDIP